MSKNATEANGNCAVAEGYKNKANGDYAHSEGEFTYASGRGSHSEGTTTTASGRASHSEGFNTFAPGYYAHTQGNGTQAYNQSQTALGEYNIKDPSNKPINNRGTYIEIVGNGTDSDHRSNARTLDWSGNEWLAGSLSLGQTSINEQELSKVKTLGENVAIDDSKTYDLDDYVKNTDWAGTTVGGVVKINSTYGVGINDGGILALRNASVDQIKTGDNTSKSLSPRTVDATAFYGLAKAAGDSTQSASDNAVGTYTDNAKIAIREMIGAVGVADLADYVKNTDYANNAKGGTVRINPDYGVNINANGHLYVGKATSAQMKSGSGDYRPIVSSNEHEAVFYGLAKSAGDITQASSDNAVGTYTDEAKSAIRTMIGAVDENARAGETTWGLARTNASFGILGTSEGVLQISPAASTTIKEGTNVNKPIVPARQHTAVFYGLAKASGDSTQAQSDNPIGTYTDDAKTAIRNMLGTVGTTDYATTETAGVVTIGSGLKTVSNKLQISHGSSLYIANNNLNVNIGNADTVKQGTMTNAVPSTAVADAVAFYGLAKAAGSDMKNSSNAVGTYTPEAKSAIRNMLGVTETIDTVTVSGTDPVITASPNTRYVCGEVSTLSFTPCATGICDVRFTSGSSVTILTLPQSVQMPEWFEIETNRIYEINIADGVYGGVMSWNMGT